MLLTLAVVYAFHGVVGNELMMPAPNISPVSKVPKREIFDRSDSPDFYTIKSSWVGDLLVKILTYYFNF